MSSWNFPRAFWAANIVELFERAAFYAMFIALTLYLTNVVGFSDINAAWIGGMFAAGLYFLPPFTGALADRIGFRKAIILAFSLLSVGYFALGALPYKAIVLPAIVILMLGGSFIKSVVTGTVAKTSTPDMRARAFSIFYGIVNVGSFAGKSIAYPIRLKLGLEAINYYSAGMTFLALVVVYLFYRNVDGHGEGKTIRDAWSGLVRVITNVRLVVLILIVAGFWIIQIQMYATMPKYILRTVGFDAAPEWIANVNPLVVMTCVVFITSFMNHTKAIVSMNIGMLLMPLSALCMASSPALESVVGKSVHLWGTVSVHPISMMLIAGIVVQGLAECFISPRYLEFFSLQSPKGEEGAFLGFAQMHSFIAYILGFGLSGYLLTAYCPDPKTLSPGELMHAYDQSNYIWYYFAIIGSVAAIALYLYALIVKRLDMKANTTYTPEG